MVQRTQADVDSPIREELAQLRADFDSLVGTVGRLADTAGEQLIDGAKRTFSSAQAQAGKAYDSALAGGRRSVNSAEDAIEAHPFISIAIAAGVGYLLGKLIPWRR